MRLPDSAVLMTQSIDVQARYVAVLTCGWTEECEVWMLDYQNVEGDPRDPAMLQAVVQLAHAQRYEHVCGDAVPIHLLGIDSRFLTDSVHAAVAYGNRLRAGRWCLPTAGIGGRVGEPIVLREH